MIFYNLYLTYYQINMLPAKLERELSPPLVGKIVRAFSLNFVVNN